MSKKLTDEQKAEKRLKVAKELATKDGRTFEHLTEMMQNAYLHNADCAIVDREAKPISATGQIVPAFTCPICKDMGFIGDTPCYDCNPVGLPKGALYPEAKTDSFEGTNPPDGQEYRDRVAESKKIIEAKAKSKAEGYICGKCNVKHLATSKIGKRHLKYVVKPLEVKDDDSASRVRPDNNTPGSPDTGKPEQPQKPKAEKKA